MIPELNIYVEFNQTGFTITPDHPDEKPEVFLWERIPDREKMIPGTGWRKSVMRQRTWHRIMVLAGKSDQFLFSVPVVYIDGRRE